MSIIFTQNSGQSPLHYNGSTWAWYPNLFRYPETLVFHSVSMYKNHVFIVGEWNDIGLIVMGTR